MQKETFAQYPHIHTVLQASPQFFFQSSLYDEKRHNAQNTKELPHKPVLVVNGIMIRLKRSNNR
jgi:hypothetical protein